MRAAIRYTEPKRLLNPAGGYLSGYDYSLNPYAGCVYACSYCYVRCLPVALLRDEPWGAWVDVKRGAAERLRGELRRAKRKGGTAIFMSSATDPYQPLEHRERVTRSLIEAMAEDPPDFLFVQTRSPLVTRDIDLLLRLGPRTRVSITVETDLEPIRKAFTPAAPPIAARLRALERLSASGVPVQAAISPLLPCSDEFPKKLAAVVDRVCLDDFFMGDGSGGRRTERLGIARQFAQLNLEHWYDRTAYLRFLDKLRQYFPDEHIGVNQQGFLP